MKIVGLTVLCVYYVATSQAQNAAPVECTVPEYKSRWDDITTSNPPLLEATKLKRDKFSCVLNLLKDALAEELQNCNQITEDTDQQNVLTSIKNIIEEKQALENNETQLEKPFNVINEENLPQNNESPPLETIKIDDEKCKQNEHVSFTINDENCIQNNVISYQNALTDMRSALSYPQNVSNDQNRIDMPTMIPIFKPRSNPIREPNQNSPDVKSIVSPVPASSRQTPNSKAVSSMPEKIVQTNLSPNPRTIMFDIPCQRATDVLDMNIGIPQQAVCKNVNPITKSLNTNVPKQSTSPVIVNYADEADTVAMLFKPKNITLQQVYGNLLKTITITVLVPYHMSKIGEKNIMGGK